MENSDKFRIALMVVVYVITAVFCSLGAFALYNLIAVQKPWTIGVAYADILEYSEDNPAIIDVKINSNENSNGQALYELQFNSYTDQDGNGVSGFGIQCVGGWQIRHDYESLPNYKQTEGLFGGISAEIQNIGKKGTINKDEKYLQQFETYAVGDFYLYYTGDNGVTYSYLSVDELDDYLLIDIDGKFYKLTLKDYSYITKEAYKGFTGLFRNFWSANTITHTVKYSWFDVFNAVMQSAFKNSGKEEFRKYALPLMDLSKYLTIEYKDEDGKYHPVEKTTENRYYFSIPVEHYKNGATEVSDSKFKMVGYSTTWSYYNSKDVQDFWQVAIDHLVTQKHLNYIYYESYGKKFLTIDAKFANYLKTIADVEIIIDMDALSQPVGGIDLKYFDIKTIKSFTINNVPQEFEMLNKDQCSVEITLNKAV